MLVNHFIANFLVVIIIFFYGLIIYFNLNSAHTVLENKKVSVYDDLGECNYDDLPAIPDSQTCAIGENKGLYFITEEDITYTLSTVASNYANICKTLCDNYNSLSNECVDEKNIFKFHDCITLLSPKAGCRDLSAPLGYRLAKNSKQKVNFYARDIVTPGTNC